MTGRPGRCLVWVLWTSAVFAASSVVRLWCERVRRRDTAPLPDIGFVLFDEDGSADLGLVGDAIVQAHLALVACSVALHRSPALHFTRVVTVFALACLASLAIVPFTLLPAPSSRCALAVHAEALSTDFAPAEGSLGAQLVLHARASLAPFHWGACDVGYWSTPAAVAGAAAALWTNALRQFNVAGPGRLLRVLPLMLTASLCAVLVKARLSYSGPVLVTFLVVSRLGRVFFAQAERAAAGDSSLLVCVVRALDWAGDAGSSRTEHAD
eukprot:a344399_32.p1 GENE.a344399_32~~a344399_32.p1  ORF type:complete len:288 (-),score=65.40 a344399_32:269-1072(-)